MQLNAISTKYCEQHISLSAFLIVFTLLVFAAPSAAQETIPISVSSTIGTEFDEILAKHNNDPTKLTSEDFRGKTRVIADLGIITKALRLGGLKVNFEHLPATNARRETLQAASGKAALCGQQFNQGTTLAPDHQDAFFVSDPITRFGEFEKGVYCLPDNNRLLAVRTAPELNRSGDCIVGLHWNNDIIVLSNMGITNLIAAPTFEAMFKMVEGKRGDWLPLEFSSAEDLSITYEGVRLVPVPGIKFSLLESRHFLVSKKHPKGREIFQALQKGIAIMREHGEIRAFLVASGFFNPAVADWSMLNEDAVKAGIFPPVN